MNRKTGNLPPQRAVPHELPQGEYIPTWGPLRPGADDALAIPSRTGNVLSYRDGRKVVLS